MKITELAVRNYQFTVVVFLMLVTLGVFSYIKIPQAEDPEFPISIFPVIAIFPGASPADIEELVVDRIEKSMNELEDLVRIKTEIKDGVAVIVVEFSAECDPDKKFDEVMRQVNSLKPSMPEGLYSLEVLKIQAGNTNIVQCAIVSDSVSYDVLGSYAEELRDMISAVEGVRKAEALAYPAREVKIEVDLQKIALLNISIGKIISAVQSDNSNIPAGSIDIGPKKFNISIDKVYDDLEGIRNTIISSYGGQIVFLKDVATVDWQSEEVKYFGRFNGEKAAFVVASMKTGFNIHRVKNEIYRVFDSFEKDLPEGIRIERGFDQSQNVRNKLSRLEKDFLFAFFLVMITLLPLGFRASGTVLIAIPLSIMIGVTGLYFIGFSINQLSIVGGVIALGLLVDDSIVVIENISRWVREGHLPYNAAIGATSQIGTAVLGCTATLVFAFLPLMFLPGMAGKYMRSLPTTITFVVIGSLFVALTIIPFIASLVLKGNVNPQGNTALRIFHKIIDLTYSRALKWSLDNPLKTVIIGAVLFFASLFLVKVIGFSLFPKAGMPQFLITIETPRGSNINETDRAVRFVESVLKNRPEVKYFMSNIGKGNPMIYYNSFQKSGQSTLGEVMCEVRQEFVPQMHKFVDWLRDTLNAYANGRIYVNEFENGMPVDAPIAVRLIGDNLDTLNRYAGIIEDVIRRTPGTIYIKNPLSQSLTDLKLIISREKAGMLGVPTVEVERTVRLALAGIEAGKFRDNKGREYPIIICQKKTTAENIERLNRIYVSSLSGEQIPLSHIARLEFYDSPTLIQHYNRERSITVSSSVQTGFNTDKTTKEILSELEKIKLPEGYRIIPAGEIESRRESFAGIWSAILIAVFGIFLILLLEFKTFRGTLIVLTVIPLGIIGGLLMLWITGNTLSFAAAVGFVALIGIEIKNSILLVDFTNQLREQGMPLDEAIRKAGEIRFLPVVLTTLTAVGGLMPIALSGSELYSPLAFVIIGGLITSTLLARLVTPVMYRLIPPEIKP